MLLKSQNTLSIIVPWSTRIQLCLLSLNKTEVYFFSHEKVQAGMLALLPEIIRNIGSCC